MAAAHILKQGARPQHNAGQIMAVIERARLGGGANVNIQTVRTCSNRSRHIVRMAAHVRQQKSVALLRNERVTHGPQRGPIGALAGADGRRKQLHKLYAVKNQRAQNFLFVLAREEVALMVMQ